MGHQHRWTEDEVASAMIEGYTYDCTCGAVKNAYIEADGSRETVIHEAE